MKNCCPKRKISSSKEFNLNMDLMNFCRVFLVRRQEGPGRKCFWNVESSELFKAQVEKGAFLTQRKQERWMT